MTEGRGVILLQNSDHEVATATALRIAHDLSEWMDLGGSCPEHSGSAGELAGRHAGVCLMFLEVARATGNPRWLDSAAACWTRSVNAIGTSACGPDFFTGFTGAAWVGDLLERFVERDGLSHPSTNPEADSVSAIDSTVLSLLRRPGQRLPDLLGGVSGIGLYMSLRTPRRPAVDGLKAVVEWLDRTAVADARGIYWIPDRGLLPSEYDRTLYSDGSIPLGTAHGLAGIMSVIARAIASGVEVRTAMRLFEGGVAFLLRSRMNWEGRQTFPRAILRDGSPAMPTLSWCWGDIGVIGSLHSAALRAGHADLENEMVEAAIASASVVPSAASMHDASLCHGTAGRAHILNRLYQQIGADELAMASRLWFRESLRRAGPGRFGGYTFRVKSGSEYRALPSPGVLLGSAGVALALLSACSAEVPLWDVPFAVDVPPISAAGARHVVLA